MAMIVVNIHEVKARLSEYVEAATRGERVVICKRNHPVAELRAVEQKRTVPRPIGGGRHAFDVPPSAFEPLSEEDLDDWDRGPVYPDTSASPSRAAERPERPYSAPSRKPRR